MCWGGGVLIILTPLQLTVAYRSLPLRPHDEARWRRNPRWSQIYGTCLAIATSCCLLGESLS